MTPGLLILGGGLAAQRCCETLRALGHEGSITIAGRERAAPYDRPPLSKTELAGAPSDLGFRPPGWYVDHGIELVSALRPCASARRRGPSSWRAASACATTTC